MSKPTKYNIQRIRIEFQDLLDREYPDTRELNEEDEDVAFDTGMRDAFSMTFSALCEQAFPPKKKGRL